MKNIILRAMIKRAIAVADSNWSLLYNSINGYLKNHKKANLSTTILKTESILS